MATVRRILEPPTTAARSAATKTLREVLVSLARREYRSSEELEPLFRQVDAKLATLPKRSWVFDQLDRVIGKSGQRNRDAVFVVVTLAGTPGGESRLVRYVNDKSASVRLEVMVAIHRQRWNHFAPFLAERLVVEEDPACRSVLMTACGDFREPATLDALLAVANDDLDSPSDDRHRILFNLRKHRDPRARPYFEAVFEASLPDASSSPTDASKEVSVLAAWGVLTLGPEPKAHAFLVTMLDDVRVVHIRDGQISGVAPGLSERAAQALADIHGMPFRWGKGDAPKIRALVRRLPRPGTT